MNWAPGIHQLLPAPAHLDLVVVPHGAGAQTVVALALVADAELADELTVQPVVLRNGALVVSYDDVWEREASDA